MKNNNAAEGGEGSEAWQAGDNKNKINQSVVKVRRSRGKARR